MLRGIRIPAALAIVVALHGCSGGSHAPGPTRNPGTGTCTPGDHSTADAVDAEAYCVALLDVYCDRAFADCGPEIGDTGYGSADACRAGYASLCGYSDFSDQFYDAACAQSCLAYVSGAPCSVFTGSEPQACAEATGTVPPPPPPSCTSTITDGTITDTISSSDPLWNNGYAKSYCLSLTAGDSITLQTSAPLSGTAIGDTVLYLLAPDGSILSYNDNYSASYSRVYYASVPTTGTYRVIVRGYSTSYVGSYQLTVTTGAPSSCVATITAGTIQDTITSGDPLYYGSHSRTYCLSLTAGHSVTLDTLAPTSGTEIYDTVLYLVSPSGTLLASNDDYSALYSHIYYSSLPATGVYHVIVTGWSSSDLGSYRLTVTAP